MSSALITKNDAPLLYFLSSGNFTRQTLWKVSRIVNLFSLAFLPVSIVSGAGLSGLFVVFNIYRAVSNEHFGVYKSFKRRYKEIHPQEVGYFVNSSKKEFLFTVAAIVIYVAIILSDFWVGAAGATLFFTGSTLVFSALTIISLKADYLYWLQHKENSQS